MTHPAFAERPDRWERGARYIGTPKYLLLQTLIVVVWVAYNALAVHANFRGWAFDKYPFILLNLMFSLQAAYTGPILQLAANKTQERDRQQAALDYQHNLQTLEIAKALHAKIIGPDAP